MQFLISIDREQHGVKNKLECILSNSRYLFEGLIFMQMLLFSLKLQKKIKNI